MNAETSLTTAQVVSATGVLLGFQASKRTPPCMSGGALLFALLYRQGVGVRMAEESTALCAGGSLLEAAERLVGTNESPAGRTDNSRQSGNQGSQPSAPKAIHNFLCSSAVGRSRESRLVANTLRTFRVDVAAFERTVARPQPVLADRIFVYSVAGTHAKTSMARSRDP